MTAEDCERFHQAGPVPDRLQASSRSGPKSVDGTAVRLLRRRMACRKDDLILLIENFDIKLRAQDVHDIFQIIDADRSEQKICCSPFAVKDRSKIFSSSPSDTVCISSVITDFFDFSAFAECSCKKAPFSLAGDVLTMTSPSSFKRYKAEKRGSFYTFPSGFV